jgi:hypothetical protein
MIPAGRWGLELERCSATRSLTLEVQQSDLNPAEKKWMVNGVKMQKQIHAVTL